ncbi:MAG: peptidylprolyl isomerase [Gallionellaceae bacterium CG_4_9_14_0_8_um_filter_60_335]|nr:MAG: peptidylprolyl isomerase [Gallionellaceae bacterium CG02_land_8_20_14_3_00_60_115]PJC04798.1 MAG: peptidylprolyl isomerase [Gallionellaceae bacterium CG_4_9_14_0_8_um_filter_60_335]
MPRIARVVLFSSLLLASAAAQAADADKTAALVNGVAIPQSRIDLRLKAAEQQGQPDGPELRKALRQDLINLEIISQEAGKLGLEKQAETAQQLELARQSVLAGAFVQDYLKNHPVDDALLQQDYETMKARIGDKEYKVSHILVPTEEEAKAVAKRVNKESFTKLAKQKSQDPGSKDKGGDLGWTVPSNFVQPFGEAIGKLAKGQISAPVQTQYGWHVIKLEDTRELKVPAFDDVKPNLEKRRQQEVIQKAISELRSKAKVE